MAFTNIWKVVFLFAIAFFDVTNGIKYIIGDTAGWTASGTVDYSDWVANKNFKIGDQLEFKYNKKFHNVMEVNSQDFESCNSTSPIFTYTTGQDLITLTTAGHHYFLCSTSGHCEAGQKVDIFVRGPSSCGLSTNPPHDHNSASFLGALLSSKRRLFAIMLACFLFACTF